MEGPLFEPRNPATRLSVVKLPASKFVALGLVGCLLAACASAPHRVILPPPNEVTSLGSGDVFELRIVGEDKLPTAFTIASDGTADLPYIKRVKVAGLEPQQVAEL